MIHFIQHIFHNILNWTGSSNTAGNQYGFWSGFGSDIGEVLLLGGIIQLYRKHNCHVKGCPRIGKHTVQGTDYITCKKHHPNLPKEDITAKHISDAYRQVIDKNRVKKDNANDKRATNV